MARGRGNYVRKCASSIPTGLAIRLEGIVLPNSTWRKGEEQSQDPTDMLISALMSQIGIVGRTGAGKSSCLQALFRLVELSGGKVTVDGVDLSKVGLDTLRQCLSAIPQEPLLFRGSMRENLDPEGKRTDPELHDSLFRCGLLTDSQSEEDRLSKFRLDAQVADEGSNFS